MNKKQAQKVFDAAEEVFVHETTLLVGEGDEDYGVAVELRARQIDSDDLDRCQRVIDLANEKTPTDTSDISEVAEGEDFKEPEPGDETPAQVGDESTGAVDCNFQIAIKGDADPLDGETEYQLVAIFQ